MTDKQEAASEIAEIRDALERMRGRLHASIEMGMAAEKERDAKAAEVERLERTAHDLARSLTEHQDHLAAARTEIERLRAALVLAEDALQCGKLNQIQEEALTQVRGVLRGQLEQSNG